jgi:phage tail-like protein
MPWLRRDVTPGPAVAAGGSYQFSGPKKLKTVDFLLEVEGLLLGDFGSLTGGDMAVTQVKHDITYESGSSTTLLIPGTTSFGAVTLSQGFGDYMSLYNWFMLASNGHIIAARRNATIQMLNNRVVILQWNLENAWLTKLSSFTKFTLEASDSKKARLAVTIAAETISYEEIGAVLW